MSETFVFNLYVLLWIGRIAIYRKHITRDVRGVNFIQPILFACFAVITMIRHTITHFVSIIDQSGMRFFVVNII